MGEIAFAAMDPTQEPVRILRRGVAGEHCVSAILGLGDPRPSYGEAAKNALAGIPGATVVVNANLHYRHTEGLTHYFCATVTGDAGAFE
jgi:hypothetical protein